MRASQTNAASAASMILYTDRVSWPAPGPRSRPRFLTDVAVVKAGKAGEPGPLYRFPADLKNGKRKLVSVEFIVGPSSGAEVMLVGVRSHSGGASHEARPGVCSSGACGWERTRGKVRACEFSEMNHVDQEPQTFHFSEFPSFPDFSSCSTNSSLSIGVGFAKNETDLSNGFTETNFWPSKALNLNRTRSPSS